jgi:hypothetical protein
VEAARSEAEQLLAAAHSGAALPEPESEQQAAPGREPPAEPAAEAEAPAPEPKEPSPAPSGGFTPPPSSLEDLAAASRPKFSVGGRPNEK